MNLGGVAKVTGVLGRRAAKTPMWIFHVSLNARSHSRILCELDKRTTVVEYLDILKYFNILIYLNISIFERNNGSDKNVSLLKLERY